MWEDGNRPDFVPLVLTVFASHVRCCPIDLAWENVISVSIIVI